MAHVPVLLEEVLDFLRESADGNYIDGTAGDGGYILALAHLKPKSRILGIDLDQVSLGKLSMRLVQEDLSQRVKLAQGNFKEIKRIAADQGFKQATAVILDLGFSSSQLDEPTRGLSFQQEAVLDMRFDQGQELTAERIINTYAEPKLAELFREFGEEKFASKIAREIVQHRSKTAVSKTSELFEIIHEALPKPIKHKAADSARRIFQALRIEVNGELSNLTTALPEIAELLVPGGRMLVISFHSLEDRIVKRFFVQESRGCVCPPEFPQCVCEHNPRLRVLTKKPVTASEQERAENPRSFPAKLRVAQKV
ncbi:MAG TPA: 16S rRNA (cytosine(1402)-N(4))-methyltransferase RsmH [Patescibacteria group bacterium]|nr:16S rRNA (cytosine(1402)-N(4))-methyltransferase RsmH [Patescibacteria group bacterium]